METIVVALVIWFAVSIIASLAIGRLLGAMSRRQITRKPLAQTQNTYSRPQNVVAFAQKSSMIGNSK